MVKAPLVVVVGETASGKSALAMELARQFNGEIIAADSRTVYKGLDIGTAKPSKDDQADIRHHGIDVVKPNERFTAHDFQQLAYAAMDDMYARGKTPIMVGGTGLYVDSVLFTYQFLPRADESYREKLQNMPVSKLQEELEAKGVSLPENRYNPRHLIRKIETNGEKATAKPLREATLVLRMEVPYELLRARVEERVVAMVKAGLLQEAEAAYKKYGWECEAMKGIGYREFRPYFEESATLQQVQQQIIADTLKYAKRQRTWFRRPAYHHKSIHTVSEQAEAVAYTTTFLNKYPL